MIPTHLRSLANFSSSFDKAPAAPSAPPALTRTLDKTLRLLQQTQALAQLTQVLVDFSCSRMNSILSGHPGTRQLSAKATALSVLPAMSPTFAQQSWDAMRKVEYLLQRPSRGGVALSAYEHRIASDQLHRNYQKAADAYQSLHQETTGILETLRHQQWTTATELSEALRISIRAKVAPNSRGLKGDVHGVLHSKILQAWHAHPPIWRQSLSEQSLLRGDSPLQQLASVFASIDQSPQKKAEGQIQAPQLTTSTVLPSPIEAHASISRGPRACASQSGVLRETLLHSPPVEQREEHMATASRVKRTVAASVGTPPPAPRSPERTATLINALNGLQQDMIRLNNSVPSPLKVLEGQLDSWRRKEFRPLFPDSMTGSQSLILYDDKGSLKEEVPLLSLYLKAISGERLPDLSRFDILHDDKVRSVPDALNTQNVKNKIRQFLSQASPAKFVEHMTQTLNDFWELPSGDTGGRRAKDWLAIEFSQQLWTQANVAYQQGNLSADMLRIVERVVTAPNAQSREQLFATTRLGVYALHNTSTPGVSDNSQPVSGAYVITQHDNLNNSGGVLLWRPGQPLKAFENIKALLDEVKARGVVAQEPFLMPVQENLFSRRVADLRQQQVSQLFNVLADMPQDNVRPWLETEGRYSIDMSALLDLSPTILVSAPQTNNTDQALFEQVMPTWLIAASDQDQAQWHELSQAARQSYERFVQSSVKAQQQPVEVLQAEFIKSGLPGTVHDYRVIHSVVLPGMRTPTPVTLTLSEAAMSGNAFELGAVRLLRDDQDLPAEQFDLLKKLLNNPALRTSPAERLTQLQAQLPVLQEDYAQALGAELKRDVLEATLKGHLGGDDTFIQGREVITAAMRGDSDVQVGQLQLATNPGGNGITAALTAWLVFVRKDAQGKDKSVVLYRPQDGAVTTYSSRQKLYQYLDQARLGQDLAAEVKPGAAPGTFVHTVLQGTAPKDRHAMQQFLALQAGKTTVHTGHNLQFIPFPGSNMKSHLKHWAGNQLESMVLQMQPMVRAPHLVKDQVVESAIHQRYTAFVNTNIPSLEKFTQQHESTKLTKLLREKAGLPPDSLVDASKVSIEFNGYKVPLNQWVQQGLLQRMGVKSIDFMGNARIEFNDRTLTPQMNRQLTRVLNGELKERVQRNLLTTYIGTQYIEFLKQRLQPNDLIGQQFRELKQASTLAQLRLTLEVEQANGRIPAQDYQWMKPLLDGLPRNTTRGNARLSQFQINGRRIPDVLMLSQLNRSGTDRTSTVVRNDFVFLPQGPYGNELIPLEQYRALLKTPSYQDNLLDRVRLEDTVTVDNVLKGVRDKSAPTALVSDFSDFSNQRLLDMIDNADEQTTSLAEEIWEVFIKGARFATMAVCIAGTGGLGVMGCALGTAFLMGVDIKGAIDKLRRGDQLGALEDVMFLGFDALDTGAGLKLLKGLTPKKLLHWTGLTRFKNVEDVQQAMKTFVQQSTAFTSKGRLNPELAITGVNPQTTTRPGKANAGTFYAQDGKTYIKEDGQVFEVYSNDDWITVRVKNSQHPNRIGAPLEYREKHWQAAAKVTDVSSPIKPMPSFRPPQRLPDGRFGYLAGPPSAPPPLPGYHLGTTTNGSGIGHTLPKLSPANKSSTNVKKTSDGIDNSLKTPIRDHLEKGIETNTHIFKPTILKYPEMPGNIPSTAWKIDDHIDSNSLTNTISNLFGIKIPPIKIKAVSHEEVLNQIKNVPGNESMTFDSIQRNTNPAAWTSPDGVIYIGNTAPDYTLNGNLDIDKIRSTIIHESIHASSYKHIGFQKSTDTSISNANYDEYITDYFAEEVFRKLYPNGTYKTAYFTKNVHNQNVYWGGNLFKFMIESGHTTRTELINGYFNTGILPKLSNELLEKWKDFSKQKNKLLTLKTHNPESKAG